MEATIVTQEFFCSECKVYFLVTLFEGQTDYEVMIVCPACGHEHQRVIHKGEVHEKGRFVSAVRERILSTKSSVSKEPRTSKMKAAHQQQSFNGRRDGIPVHKEEMEAFLQQRWFEHSRTQGEGERWDDDNDR